MAKIIGKMKSIMIKDEQKANKRRTKDEIIMEERIKRALGFAWSYGQIDGSHHRLWVIDQMVRALCGSEEDYKNWVQTYETPDGEDYWEWDTGIAP